jgi:hypothetical protein
MCCDDLRMRDDGSGVARLAEMALDPGKFRIAA